MKKNRSLFIFIAAAALFSCAYMPPERDLSPERNSPPGRNSPPERDLPPEQVVPREQVSIASLPRRVAPIPERPQHPIHIMGIGKVEGEELSLFLEQNNPVADMDFVRALASHYINEAAFEGVNHDIAFAQMCLETGFLSYGGLVQSEWNNFCGLGAIGPQEPGLVFPDPQTGVRAHIQHLKAYATEEPLNGKLVDPRYRFVRKGSSPTIEGLSGTWAADRQYSAKINAILRRLYEFSF